MLERELGKTGLKVSAVGLGGGGNSRLGLSYGKDDRHAADVVRAALDMGITMIDTARAYGTERAVGQALKGRARDGVVVSSKSPYVDQGQLISAETFAQNIDISLRELGLETIDVYFIHGLRQPYYAEARERFQPVLEQARQAGKVRFSGLTEAFETDTRHEMYAQALRDGGWDVFMVGHNLLNPSGQARVLEPAAERGVGTLGMFAVRRALIDERLLRQVLGRLAQEGQIGADLANPPDLMETLGLRGVSENLAEAAYRFCTFTPGMDCVLSGTSSAAHLRENLRAVEKGPLPEETLARLDGLFGKIDSISGQVRD